MISLKVLEVKSFMSHLLVHNVFDNFLLSELDITTFNNYHVSGKLIESYYSSEELELLKARKYSTWNEIKPFAFSIVKGNKLPSSIKIIFLLSEENTDKLLANSNLAFKSEEINGLFLNVRYENGNLYIITGTSIKTFTLDKSLDNVWDTYVKAFLKHYEITVEENK
jgi:hypothetical protein